MKKLLSGIILFLYIAIFFGGFITPGMNVHAAESNLIKNSSVETVGVAANRPDSWQTDSWGTNAPVFTYENTGHTGSRSVTVNLQSVTSGDAKWAHDPVDVSPMTQYNYTDYYKSTIESYVVAQLDDGNGNYTYVDMQAAPASAGWKAYSGSFTTAASTKSVIIYHVIAGIGTLTTDDFSLLPVISPVVTDNMVANPSFENVDVSDAPQDWLKGGWGSNTHTYSYPSSGRTGSRSASVAITAYTSGDVKWYFKPVTVQPNTTYEYSDFYTSNIQSSIVAQLDDGTGNYSYEFIADTPASPTWRQFKATFKTTATTRSISIFHIIANVGNLALDDVSFKPVMATATAPTGSITSPGNSTTLTGTANISAQASAHGGNVITGVQFQIDSENIGAIDSTAPYSLSLNTAQYADGAHTFRAVIMAEDGQTTTTAPVNVIFANGTGNSIKNPSLETPSSTAPTTTPAEWYRAAWGNNATAFTYANGGRTGSKSVRIDMTNFVDGGANWSYDGVPVTGGRQYSYAGYYQSNANTQVIVAVKLVNGTTQYLWLGNPYVSNGAWTKFSANFMMPGDAVSATVSHNIVGNGYLMTDDYDLRPYIPAGFSEPMVSITFDDGISGQYQNALPILNQHGFKGTFYIVSGLLNTCEEGGLCYMTNTQVQSLYNGGHEIGSHTVDHSDLTMLNDAQVTAQLANSRTALQQLTGAPVANFASPYGRVNASVIDKAQSYYSSHRGVELGYNGKDNFSPFGLLVQDINSSTTVAQVQGYINHAKATNTWLILMYHDINTDDTVDPGYNNTPSDFAAHMAYLNASGIAVVTMQQGLQIAASQIQ